MGNSMSMLAPCCVEGLAALSAVLKPAVEHCNLVTLLDLGRRRRSVNIITVSLISLFSETYLV